MSLPLALAPGTVIGGHYIIQTRINSGGFGAVYRGIDTSEGNRPCAIKETYDVTPPARRQALMEASVLFTIKSDHLPAVYDAFEANGRFYLAMQLIEGLDLLQLLKSRIGNTLVGEQEPYQMAQGPFSEQEIISWLVPVMDVLQELHSRNPAVIHRDIKPGNIILTPQQRAVLVDFGLTKLYDPNSNTQSMVKAVSKGFSPVEQYMGRTTPQSDIYAMAATIYLLLTNRLPPDSVARSARDTLIAPRLLNPSLSPQTERALLTALAVQPDQRYATIREFAQALSAPAFTGFADPTISLAPTLASGPASAHTVAAPVQLSPVYVGVQQPPRSTSGIARTVYPLPVPAQPAPKAKGKARAKAPVPAKATPARPTPAQVPPQPPPGFMMVPRKPLPRPMSQGCLWGLVQGVLGAVIVLSVRQEAYYYLIMLMGFLFCLLAGFITTRRGGISARGAWSGFWTGFYGTIIFWTALFVGLVARAVQRIQADRVRAPQGNLPGDEIAHAWSAGLPHFPQYTFVASQPGWVNTLIFLSGSIVLASIIGWAGGMLGRSRQPMRSRHS